MNNKVLAAVFIALPLSFFFTAQVSATAQSPYLVRVIDGGKKAVVVNRKSSKVVRTIQNFGPAVIHVLGSIYMDPLLFIWTHGVVSNDGSIVVMQNKKGKSLEVFDFSEEKVVYHVLYAGMEPKFCGINRSDEQKTTIAIHNRKVFALGKPDLGYGLLVWDLDHPVQGRMGSLPNKILGRTKDGDSLVRVGNKHVYVRTKGWLKPYVYKVAIETHKA